MTAVRRLLLTTDAVGGVWTYSLELAQALERLGVETVLGVLGPPPSDEQCAEASGSRILVTGLPLDWTASRAAEVNGAARGLARLAKDEGVDLVQLHSAALAAETDFPVPVVAVQHSCVATWWNSVREGPLPSDFRWRRDLVEAGLNTATAIVAPTAAFAEQTARTYRLSRPVEAVHNGRTPLAVGHDDGGRFVLTVGRLWDEGKNVRTLDAAAAMLDVPVEAVGTLAGPGGSVVRFDHLLTPENLPPQALAERLGARPVFASAALYEPFGLSVLEAAQAGCALVLSDIPTFRELWEGAALFVPARDASGFAVAIERLFDDPAERDRLGEAAQARADRYSPAAMAEQMLAIYERVRTAQETSAPALEAGIA